MQGDIGNTAAAIIRSRNKEDRFAENTLPKRSFSGAAGADMCYIGTKMLGSKGF